MNLHPSDIKRLTGGNILVTRYVRPEIYGSIVIPDMARVDPFWAYWEVVDSGPDVARLLGTELEEGDIVRTPFRPPIPVGRGEDNTEYFIISAEVKKMRDGKLRNELNVTGVFKRTWGFDSCSFTERCPVCNGEVELKYTFDTVAGEAYDCYINEAECDCLIGDDWVEDVFEEYLS